MQETIRACAPVTDIDTFLSTAQAKPPGISAHFGVVSTVCQVHGVDYRASLYSDWMCGRVMCSLAMLL